MTLSHTYHESDPYDDPAVLSPEALAVLDRELGPVIVEMRRVMEEQGLIGPGIATKPVPTERFNEILQVVAERLGSSDPRQPVSVEYAPFIPFGSLFDQPSVPYLKVREAHTPSPPNDSEDYVLTREDLACLGMRRADDPWDFSDLPSEQHARKAWLDKLPKPKRQPRKARRKPEGIVPPNALRTGFHFPPRGLSREEAAAYVGVSARKFDELVADGRMPQPVRVDGRRIWDHRALDQKFDALSGSADVDQWEDGA